MKNVALSLCIIHEFLWHCPLKACGTVLRNGCWLSGAKSDSPWSHTLEIDSQGYVAVLGEIDSPGHVTRGDWLNGAYHTPGRFQNIGITLRIHNRNRKYLNPMVSGPVRLLEWWTKSGGRTSRWTVPVKGSPWLHALQWLANDSTPLGENSQQWLNLNLMHLSLYTKMPPPPPPSPPTNTTTRMGHANLCSMQGGGREVCK